MYSAIYKHKAHIYSYRDGLTGAGNTVSIEDKHGGEERQETVAKNATQPSNKNFRLPASLRPTHYIVRVQPFISGNYSVRGSVQIGIEVLQATSNITLHAYGMDIHTEGIQVRCDS